MIVATENHRYQHSLDTNPNHHLWHNGNRPDWWIHYSIYPTTCTKQRVRKSLGTTDVLVARQRRDIILGISR